MGNARKKVGAVAGDGPENTPTGARREGGGGAVGVAVVEKAVEVEESPAAEGPAVSGPASGKEDGESTPAAARPVDAEPAGSTESAEGDAAPDASSDTPANGGDKKQKRTWPRWVGALVVVALVAAAIPGFFLWRELREDRLRDSAGEAASRMITNLATYGHEDFQANIDAVDADATDEFAKKYDEVASSLKDLVVNGKGESTATVPHVAVESVDAKAGTATVLVFLDQKITNVAVPDGRQDVSRMLATLTRVDGEWKLQDAQTV